MCVLCKNLTLDTPYILPCDLLAEHGLDSPVSVPGPDGFCRPESFAAIMYYIICLLSVSCAEVVKCRIVSRFLAIFLITLNAMARDV